MNQPSSQTVRNFFTQLSIWILGAVLVIGLIALMIVLLIYVPILGLALCIGLAFGSLIGSVVFILSK